MDSTDNAEHLLGSLRRDPGGYEVVHAERIDVAQVDGRKCLRCLVAVTVRKIAVDSNGHEAHAEILQAIEDDGTDPLEGKNKVVSNVSFEPFDASGYLLDLALATTSRNRRTTCLRG